MELSRRVSAAHPLPSTMPICSTAALFLHKVHLWAEGADDPVGFVLLQVRRLRKWRNESGMRNAWFPGRERPACPQASPLKEAGDPLLLPGTQGRSRSLPNDRPVIHGGGTEASGFPVISSLSISPRASALPVSFAGPT